MINLRIGSRQQFKEYCLRKLGAPVIMINVADEQVEDRIDDALDKFWEFHGEGNLLIPLKVQVTQEMLDTGIIPLPETVIGVNRMLNPGATTSLSSVNLQYQEFMVSIMDVHNITNGGGLSRYAQSMSYLSTINQLLGNTEKPVQFNRFRGQVEVYDGLTPNQVDDWIILECWVLQNPDDWKATWNNQWLKEYSCALIQRQWGNNLIKFPNAPLPGGVTVNGEGILQAANSEIEKLEKDLYDIWSDPPSFFMG